MGERRPVFLHPCPTGNKLERANHSRASQKHITLWLWFGYIEVILHNKHKNGKIKNQSSKPMQSTYFLHKSDKKRNETKKEGNFTEGVIP
jgi:hypothetical protein